MKIGFENLDENTAKELNGKIEELRRQLDSLLEKDAIDAEEVMELSRRLDKLIASFYIK